MKTPPAFTLDALDWQAFKEYHLLYGDDCWASCSRVGLRAADGCTVVAIIPQLIA